MITVRWDGRNQRSASGCAQASIARGILLGEQVADPVSQGTTESKGSVFDLLTDEGREKIKNAAAQLAPKTETTFTQALTAGLAPTQERPMLTSEVLLKTTFSGLANAFKSRFVSSSSTPNPNEPVELKPGLTQPVKEPVRNTNSLPLGVSGCDNMEAGVLRKENTVDTPANTNPMESLRGTCAYALTRIFSNVGTNLF